MVDIIQECLALFFKWLLYITMGCLLVSSCKLPLVDYGPKIEVVNVTPKDTAFNIGYINTQCRFEAAKYKNRNNDFLFDFVSMNITTGIKLDVLIEEKSIYFFDVNSTVQYIDTNNIEFFSGNGDKLARVHIYFRDSFSNIVDDIIHFENIKIITFNDTLSINLKLKLQNTD